MSFSCKTPTEFSKEALAEIMISTQGKEVNLQTILQQHKGKKIVIDVWATWCRDCIEGLPKVAALQDEFPEVVFLFLSEDRTQEVWKKGIDKYQIKGEHYFIKTGAKGDFKDFLNSNWIPRYMIINEAGDIVLFKAETASDERIKTLL
ncbi:MAG: TlpA family protein disulfide reductase [Flavobacteriaceae bacterium]|nr:TlpA family protein disulfide reductase [Flavobacteriaceae bacterium]